MLLASAAHMAAAVADCARCPLSSLPLPQLNTDSQTPLLPSPPQPTLTYLYQLIEARLASYHPLLSLAGRLDVVLAHAQRAQQGTGAALAAADGPLVSPWHGACPVVIACTQGMAPWQGGAGWLLAERPRSPAFYHSPCLHPFTDCLLKHS